MTQHPILENRTPSFFDAEAVSQWLALHLKNILYGIAAAIVIIIALYFFLYRNTQLSEKEYQKAANDFIIFSRPSAGDTEAQDQALKSLQALMSQHTDLQAAYGSSIAQTLINRGDFAGARPLAQQALNRIKANNLPFYEEYAQTTILILEKKYDEALTKTQSLQSLMENEIKTINAWDKRSFSPELFPLNLFRLAMLQQEVGDIAGEIKTWKLWNQYAGIGSSSEDTLSVDPRPFRMIIQQLAIGSMSLPDYINERLKSTVQEKK